MNSLFLLLGALLGSDSDSAISEIRTRYAVVQEELKAKSCLRLESGQIVTHCCPGGGVLQRSEKTDSGKISTEWRMDGDSAMFVLVRETLPGKTTRETRVYRTPRGPHFVARIGPVATLQNQPQLPGQDTAEATALLAEGAMLWSQAGVPAMDFPFSAVTVRGMVLVEEKSTLQASSDPEVDPREVKWRLQTRELEPWQQQILGRRFCQIGNGDCATAEAFVIYSGRTPHFGEAQSDPPLSDEELLQRHTSSMPPALLVELSSPLDGPVALEGFAPREISSSVPTPFRDQSNQEFQEEIKTVDQSYRKFLTDNPEEGDQQLVSQQTWSSAPGYKEAEFTFSTDQVAVHLFGAASGEDCTSAGFFETLKLGVAAKLPQISSPASPEKSKKKQRTKKIGLTPVVFPCDPTGECSLGPAFIPWNRRGIHLHATESMERQWIRELDNSFQWIIHQDISVPFHDCGC
ncbi:MAG: hypothetical protein IPN71_13365 [Fibrobacteres bacterium]|nr:hypothetical protein [Fibrobacterota bacterium]